MNEDDVHMCALCAHCVFVAAPEADESLDPVQSLCCCQLQKHWQQGPQGIFSSAVRAFTLISNELPKNVFGFTEFERSQNITTS